MGFCVTTVRDDPIDIPEAQRTLAAGWSPARRTEFATGRSCAHAALDQVGAPPGTLVLRDERGAPRWPAGFVGSITHTAGWTGAVAARTGWRHGIRSVGLDAEASAPLPRGVLDVVASRRERRDLAHLELVDPATPWDAVLFTAKEATYKAWYPLTGTVLSHDDIDVRITADGRFTARASAAARGTQAVPVRGRWVLGSGVVLSLGVVD